MTATQELVNLNLNILGTLADTYFEQDTQILELKEKISQAVEEAKEITVLTTSSVETAAHYIKNFSSMERVLESLRKEAKNPLIEKGKEIDAYFKKLQFSFCEEKARLEKEVLDWQNKQKALARQKAEEERKRLEDEAIAAAIKKEAELKAAAIKKGEDPAHIKVEVAIVPETVMEAPKLSQKNSSGLTSARRKSIEIIDPALIPREYLMPDEAKIKAERMKYDFEAKSTIPGVKFTYTESLR
jgi:hypothetical protein